MEGRIELYRGGTFVLPPLLSWRLTLTGSVPCDSFSLTCPFEASMARHLEQAWRVELLWGSDHSFRGVIDEYEIVQDSTGCRLRINGRGMAALLLDNESEAVEYAYPTLSELLRNHVASCGISWGRFSEIRGRVPYAVRSGSSQWKALSAFTRCAGGFEPRFTPDGILQVTPWHDNGKRLVIGKKTPLLKLHWRDKRYGVYSEVLVVDKVRRTRQRVTNDAFQQRGGCCRRVLYTPGRSHGTAMRYTGNYQIEQSKKEARQLTAVLPGMPGGHPGDVVRMERGDLGITGDFFVEEWCNEVDTEGERTTLTMRRLNQ